MKKFAIVFALLLAFLLAPAGCNKDKKPAYSGQTPESSDMDESGNASAAYTPRPRPWDQYYVGEAVVDMPAAASADEQDNDSDSLDDDLDALFGGDDFGDSGDSESLDMTVGGEVTLPFELYLTSEDINTGIVTGDIEWSTLGATNEIQGEVGRGSIRFEEITTVIQGRETGCIYELSPDPNAPAGTLSGTVDCTAGPGGTGTITMTIESLSGGGGADEDMDFDMDSSDDDDFDLDLGDLESNLEDDSDDADDDDSEFDESDFDAMFGDDDDDQEDADEDMDSALDDLLGGGGDEPDLEEDEIDSALDDLLGGGDEAPKPKPEKKPAPEKKPEAKPAPPAEDSAGDIQEEPMDLLMDMIDDTEVD